MAANRELIALLEDQLIPDLEAYIDDLFELVASKKSTPETVTELEETQALRGEFCELLEDARSEMDEAESAEVLGELYRMMEEG